ncbi:MAG: 16S rRNA (uracil(1498)-N(3))-methyltransferase [Candidatus Dojkabacteria bacterium]
MQKYFLRHNIKPGDITNLSDADSERIINSHEANEGDLVEVSTLNGVYHAKIVFIDKASVEIEVLEKIAESSNISHLEGLALIQAVSGDIKFNFLLEKAVELGVSEIYPVITEYSRIDLKESLKNYKKWEEVVKEASEQSRNPAPTLIHVPILLEQLQFSTRQRYCLATENINSKELSDVSKQWKNQNIICAVGPERGWSSRDLAFFKQKQFEFVTLKGNILRTETAGLVVASIYHFINGKL